MTQNHIAQAEKLIDCLQKRNFFRFSKRKRKKVWKRLRTKALFKCVIVVEMSNDIEETTFEYKAEEGKFVRTKYTGCIEYKTKQYYDSQHKECRSCENPCYLGEYTVEDFIDLINRHVFEPVNIYFI